MWCSCSLQEESLDSRFYIDNQFQKFVVRPPSVVKYCSCKREFCSVSGDFVSGVDESAAAAEAIQEEKLAAIMNEYTSEEKGNTEEGKVSNDEVSEEVSDTKETTSQTEEQNDVKNT